MTRSQAEYTPSSEVVSITIQNAGSDDYYIGGRYTNTGISLAQIAVFQGTPRLLVDLKNPGDLEPGIYTDTIIVSVCTESPCVNEIAGSPKTVTVTYTILATSVTFSSNTLDVTGDNQASHEFLVDDSISISVTNPGGRQWIRATDTNGLQTQAAHVVWTTLSDGKLQLFLRPPSSFGAGSYTDTVKLELCLNEACSRVADGSPVYLALTYTVTGSELPNVRISWTADPNGGPLLTTSMTDEPRYVVSFYAYEHLYTPIYTRYSAPTTGFIRSVTLLEDIAGTNPWNQVTLQPPASLGSGNFTDSMEFEVCFDAACTKPVPNGKYTLSFDKLVVATEGVDRRRLVPDISGATEVTGPRRTNRCTLPAIPRPITGSRRWILVTHGCRCQHHHCWRGAGFLHQDDGGNAGRRLPVRRRIQFVRVPAAAAIASARTSPIPLASPEGSFAVRDLGNPCR